MSSRAQQYHHHNSSSSSKVQQRPPPLATTSSSSPSTTASSRSARITCSICGCLNFSTESTCETCRVKPAEASTTTATTAILKKQPTAPPPRTGIVKGLRHGLPIDSYRNSGRRNSLVGAKTDRSDAPGTQPVEQLPGSTQSNPTHRFGRANSLPVIDTSRVSQTPKTMARSNSFTGSGTATNDAAAHTAEQEAPTRTQPSGGRSQGAALHHRVQERRGAVRNEARDSATSGRSSGTVDCSTTDEKVSMAALVGSSKNSGAPLSAPLSAPPTAPPRSNKRPRPAQRREVIDLISSSDEDEEDGEIRGSDTKSAPIDPAVGARSGKRPEGSSPAPPDTSRTSNRAESSALQSGTESVRPRNDAVPVAAAEARMVDAENGSPSVPVVPKDAARAKPSNDGGSPFLSRCFPAIHFDPIDFVPADAASARDIRAGRNPSGVDDLASSNQTTVPAAVASPVIPVSHSTPRPTNVMSQIPDPVPLRASPAIQTPIAVADSNPVPEDPSVEQVGSTAPISRRSSNMKRNASGKCEDQAIELGDEEESFQERISTQGGIFQSRVFQSIEFNPRDFSTVQDGLHVARRSRLSSQNEPLSHTVVSDDDTTRSSEPASAANRMAHLIPTEQPRIPAASLSSPPNQPVLSERASVPVNLPSQASSSNRQTPTNVPTHAETAANSNVPSLQLSVVETNQKVSAASVPPKESQLTPKQSSATTTEIGSSASSAGSATVSHSTSILNNPAQTSALLSSANGTAEVARSAPVDPTQPTILLPRKKIVQKPSASLPSEPKAMKRGAESAFGSEKKQIKMRQVVLVKKATKPGALGECGAEFMVFMKDIVEGDDEEPMNDEDATRELHMQLLEVVDLTNLSDSDDDESSDGDDDIREPAAPTDQTSSRVQKVAAGQLPKQSSMPLGGGQSGNSVPDHQQPGSVDGVGTKSDRRRVARQLEPCVLCEEKRWVKTLIHCKECSKYYHKKCAKEYGDDKVCWNCELDGMIDDSELTETAREEVVGMLSTLRPSSSRAEALGERDENMEGDGNSSRNSEESKKSDSADDGGGEGTDTGNHNPLLTGAATKSMQRWKAFLDVSTSTIDKTFHEVTQKITEELQSEEQRTKYSFGFTTPESFQAAISEVLDNYADLQDQLDREARDKSRGTNGDETSTEIESTGDAVTDSNGHPATPSRIIPDLSSSATTAQNVPTQVQREAAVLEGV